MLFQDKSSGSALGSIHNQTKPYPVALLWLHRRWRKKGASNRPKLRDNFARLTEWLAKSSVLDGNDISGESIEFCKQVHKKFRSAIFGVIFLPRGAKLTMTWKLILQAAGQNSLSHISIKYRSSKFYTNTNFPIPTENDRISNLRLKN